jgi:hypothetical protein
MVLFTYTKQLPPELSFKKGCERIQLMIKTMRKDHSTKWQSIAAARGLRLGFIATGLFGEMPGASVDSRLRH